MRIPRAMMEASGSLARVSGGGEDHGPKPMSAQQQRLHLKARDASDRAKNFDDSHGPSELRHHLHAEAARHHKVAADALHPTHPADAQAHYQHHEYHTAHAAHHAQVMQNQAAAAAPQARPQSLPPAPHAAPSALPPSKKGGKSEPETPSPTAWNARHGQHMEIPKRAVELSSEAHKATRMAHAIHSHGHINPDAKVAVHQDAAGKHIEAAHEMHHSGFHHLGQEHDQHAANHIQALKWFAHSPGNAVAPASKSKKRRR